MKTSVVIPTVDGREDVLARCIKAYEDTTPGELEIFVIRNKTACGIAWQEGADQATGDYIHFTADDLWPILGWHEEATSIVDRGELPAAWVMDNGEGPMMNCTCPFAPDINPPNVLVPFFSRAQYELGGWVVPIHYGSDDWITFVAASRGINIVLTPYYSFGHSAEQTGRLHNNRAIDVPKLCDLMQEYWFLPEAYKNIAEILDPHYRPILK